MPNPATRTRRACRTNREGTTRAITRTAIQTGDWDSLPTRQPSRVNRRAYLVVGE